MYVYVYVRRFHRHGSTRSPGLYGNPPAPPSQDTSRGWRSAPGATRSDGGHRSRTDGTFPRPGPPPAVSHRRLSEVGRVVARWDFSSLARAPHRAPTPDGTRGPAGAAAEGQPHAGWLPVCDLAGDHHLHGEPLPAHRPPRTKAHKGMDFCPFAQLALAERPCIYIYIGHELG